MKWLKRILSSLVPPRPSMPSPAPTPTPPTPQDGSPAYLWKLHNEARRKAGLPALAYSTVLEEAARRQALHCARTRNLTHIGPGGSDVGDRVSALGYRFRRVGENAAWAPVARVAMDRWMDSRGHRDNILGDFSEMGVASADAGGQPYWIAVFAKPL